MKSWGVLVATLLCVSSGASRLAAAEAAAPPRLSAPAPIQKRSSYKIEFGAPLPAPTPAPAPKPMPIRVAPTTPKIVAVQQKPTAASLVKNQQAPIAVDVGNVPVLERGEVLISGSDRPPEAVHAVRAGATAFRLPYEARYVDESGELRTTQIVAELAGTGLRIVGDAKTFVADLFVKLQDRDRPAAADDLPSTIEILVTGPVDTVAPDLLKFSKLSQWQKVALSAVDPPDQVTIKLRGAANVHADLPVPVLRPKTTLTINPSSIQGYGIETAELTVRVEGLPLPEGRTVLLEATRGRLEVTRLVLDGAGIGRTLLRSEGKGVSRLRATSPPLLPSETREIPFTWPLAFLLCAVLGGLCGATLRMLWNARAKEAAHWPELPMGLLVGFIVAVLGALGINVVGIELPAVVSEATIFLFGALGALIGADRLTHLLSRGSPRVPATRG